MAAELGDLSGALQSFERSLVAHDAAQDAPAQIIAWTNVGRVQSGRGRYADALRALDRAHDIAQRVRRSLDLAHVLQAKGVVHDLLGEPDKTRALLRQALDLVKAAGPTVGRETRRLGAELLGNLAIAERKLGRHDAAREYIEQALDAFQALSDPLGVALCLEQLGKDAARRGQHEMALLRYRAQLDQILDIGDAVRALGVRATILAQRVQAGEDVSQTEVADLRASARRLEAESQLVRLYSVLARQRLQAGAFDPALQAATDGVRALAAPLSGLSPTEGASGRHQHRGLYETGAWAAAKAERADALCAFLERGRAGSLLESLGGRGALMSAVVPEDLVATELAARGEAARALSQYRVATASGVRSQLRTAREALELARRRHLLAQERIIREAKAGASLLWPDPEPMAAIQNRLRSTEAVVLYGVFEEAALALVLTPTEARTVMLGSSAALRAACEAAFPSGADLASLDANVAALRKRIISPLKLGPTVRTVIAAPHGPLALIPLSVLMPERDVVFVPSASTMPFLRRGPERGSQVLALGVGTTPGRVRGATVRPLPNAPDEARAVGDVVLVNEHATEIALRTRLSEKAGAWRSIHIACHCVLHPDEPLLTSLVLHPDEDHDGLLTPLDLFDMPMKANLVVLSACSAARGKVVSGEGMLGLVRACMFAGAGTVLASVRDVDDEATAALMKSFYKAWNAGASAATALKAAQKHVRDQDGWQAPKYWAPWVLWGLPQ